MTGLARVIVGCAIAGALLAIVAASTPRDAPAAPQAPPPHSPIEHLVVIYLENWSFDGLYGGFPKADGLTPGPGTPTPLPQADKTGTPLPNLGQVPIQNGSCTPVAQTTPLPNRPFDLSPIVPPHCTTGEVEHRFYNEQYQINGGRMDRFVAWDNEHPPSLAMSHYDMAAVAAQPSLTTTPVIARWALQYTLADRWFHAAFGDSWLNHMWLVCACTPEWFGTGPPATEIIIPTITPATGNFATGDSGSTVLLPNNAGRPTWYIVDQPDLGTCPAVVASPIPSPTPTRTPVATPIATCVPLQVLPIIGDRLSQAGLDWGWYRGDIAGVVPSFQNYAPNTIGGAEHMRWIVGTPIPTATHTGNFALSTPTPTGTIVPSPTQKPPFLEALRTPGALAAVSFVRPSAADSEHPGTDNLSSGEAFVAATLIPAIMTSTPYRQNKVAIVITYDENGGRWDHVSPPNPLTPATTPGKTDQFGPGSRVPAIIISPWARRCTVDHTPYDTTSIAAFIEKNWSLAPLSARDAAADPLSGAFDFQAAPLPAGACPPIATPTTLGLAAPPTARPTGPATSGTPGVPAASAVGQTITYSGSPPNSVSGTWTRTGSGTFAFTATNASAAIVPGSVPTLFLPTTVGNESGVPLPGQATVCTPVGASAVFTTICRGTTVGNALLGAQVTVVFATAGGGTALSVGQPVAVPGPQNPTAAQPPPRAQVFPPPLLPPPLLVPLPPLAPTFLAPPPAAVGGPLAAAEPPPSVPVIPEADTLLLLVAGLGAGGVWLARRRGRRDDERSP
jgi:acid phosphatase